MGGEIIGAFVLVILFVLLFGLLICAFYYSGGKGLDKGEIRRSITITFIVMYIVLLCLSLAPSNAVLDFEGDNTFINNFQNVILVILAFYFGSRAFEVGMGARRKIRDWTKNIFSKYFEIEDIEKKTIKKLKEDMIEKVEKVDVKDLDKVKKLKEVLKEIIKSE